MCRILMDKIKLVNFAYKAYNGFGVSEVPSCRLGAWANKVSLVHRVSRSATRKAFLRVYPQVL